MNDPKKEFVFGLPENEYKSKLENKNKRKIENQNPSKIKQECNYKQKRGGYGKSVG